MATIQLHCHGGLQAILRDMCETCDIVRHVLFHSAATLNELWQARPFSSIKIEALHRALLSVTHYLHWHKTIV